MKKVILIFFFFLIFSCLDKNDISFRLESFYELLDVKQQQNFKNENLDQVIIYLKEKNNGIAFRKSKFQKLLKKEWIDFFNEEQTVEYFYTLYQRGGNR